VSEEQAAYRCPRCGAHLGAYDGERLVVGPLRVRSPFKWTCGACNWAGTWRPDPGRHAPAPAPPSENSHTPGQ
jgi:hypothetical protein